MSAFDDYQQQINALLDEYKRETTAATVSDALTALARLKDLERELDGVKKRLDSANSNLRRRATLTLAVQQTREGIELRKHEDTEQLLLNSSLRNPQSYVVLSSQIADILHRLKEVRSGLNAYVHFPRKQALWSLILGGGGQIAMGQKAKGATIILLSVIGAVAYVVPGLCIIALGMVDAYQIAKRLQAGDTIGNWEFLWSKKPKSVWKVASIEVMRISEEPIGIEKIGIDNSLSNVGLVRRHRVRVEWSQSYTIEHERAHSETTSVEPKVTESALVKRTIEDHIRDKYAYAEGKKYELEDTVEITCAPMKNIRIELHWKKILEHGEIRLIDQYGRHLDIPFTFLVRKSFDQVHVED